MLSGGFARGSYTFTPGTNYHIYVGGAGEGRMQNPGDNDAFKAASTGAGKAGCTSNMGVDLFFSLNDWKINTNKKDFILFLVTRLCSLVLVAVE